MAEKKKSTEGKKNTEIEDRIQKATDHLSLACIEIGEDYTAEVERSNYLFKIKSPLIEDDYKILNKFYNLKKELGVSDVILSPMDELPIRVLATLEYVITSVQKKSERKDGTVEWKKLETSFWSTFKENLGGESFYSNIVFPLYEDYLNFKELVDLSVDDIKKN